ncbi:OsmC family protein [Cellulomonas pakistanensis]|uniref:Peroxiredoxin n=1 Tax=Cellulomonas pakistanensis TaxID=992287 RepID=A0A919P8I5_9CELL|nr:OsmC family protein [Cellulomonas pakistanensis]GIG34940.1 peroxiredoxin [Cellulomonas pakistanensis]
MHTYLTRLRWDGSTAGGVRSYSRDHAVTAPPALAALDLSADPGFRGDAGRLNPEQLVVAAASSCQMLSFLGAAARAGVDVRGYEDEATSALDLSGPAPRLGAVRIAATVRVATGTDPDAVLALAEQAHRECYVANSLSVPVEVSTAVVTV